MIISANSIVINEYGDVLLVQRDDTRTLAPPGGACEIDEIPLDAVAREAQEETGLKVHPIRLVGLYFLPAQPEPFLFLCYRCMPRGGELATSAETPHAGFFPAPPLPKPMLAFHQEQVQRAYDHRGGPPYWGAHQVNLKIRAGLFLLNRLIYPWIGFRRSRLGLPEYVPPPQWQVRATLILSDSSGKVLLSGNDSLDSWRLPSANPSVTEPPWVKANQLIQENLHGAAVLNDLSGIYLRQGKPEMEFVFTGALEENFSHYASQNVLFDPDVLPENLLPGHRSVVADVLKSDEKITYQVLK